MNELQFIERQREREDRMEDIRFSHFKWMTYTFRFICILFLLSSCIEVLRLSADDHADFQYAYNNPPSHCVKDSTIQTEWSWYTVTSSIAYPFKSMYQTVFEPPVSSDCTAYFRKTNPVLLYFPRIPQAVSNVISNFFLTPFVMFLNKFGDALRDFLDKFNVAERFFGVIILLIGMVLSSVCFVCVMWLLLRQATPQQSQQSLPQINQLTYKENGNVNTPRKRKSARLLKQEHEETKE